VCEIQAALSSETFAVVSRLWRLPSEQSAVKMLREHILEDAGDSYQTISKIFRQITQDDIVDSSLGRESNAFQNSFGGQEFR